MKQHLRFFYFLYLLISFGHLSFGQQYTISGFVKDKSSGETLIGANIYDKKNYEGTVSNRYGFFSLTLPKDSIVLVFSYVGYQAYEMKFYLDKDINLNVGLSDSKMLDEIVITGEEEIQEITQMSNINVPITQIKKAPALLGEVDVLKVLQLLPGVQSGTEGSSGLYVRGGGPDQNLILLDGVPIYNASHLFGFFSVFNADAINNVELTKGGFPARYGGRLSSVIDISMKEGNKEKLKGEGSIGIVASKLTLEGPIKNENTTFLISGRRTYLDLIARPIIKATTTGDEVAGYYFYDLNAKINHKFSNEDRIFLSGYFGSDDAYSRIDYKSDLPGRQFESKDRFGLDWGNIIGSFRWNHIYNPKFFGNLSLTYSRYRFSIFRDYYEESNFNGTKEVEEEAIEYFSGIHDFAGKIDFEFIPNPFHYIRFGVNAIHHTFNPGILSFSSTYSSDTIVGSFKTRAVEMATYFEDDIKISGRFKANVGAHFSAFLVNNRFYFSLQPRLAVRYLMGNGLSIKASYAQMTQYIHLLTNGGVGLPTDLWLPVTENVKPQQSRQYAIGLAKTLNQKFEVSLEAYYKKMDNLIEYKEGASFLNIEQDWQDKIEVGKGESYGMEFFIQKKAGVFTGWLGYSISWANRTFENLNFGRTFPYKYDRRHDISITSIYPLSEKVELSAVWVYGTGNSITLPIASYPGSHEPGLDYFYYDNVLYYGERNSFRMKSYHRFDLSLSFSKVKKHGTRKWIVSIYNVYNHQNPFFIDIVHENDTKKFVQYSLFPVIPSISYNFKF